MVVRLVEWRARSFTDPAERLQFLQRRLGPSPLTRGGPRRTLARIPVLTTLGLALAGVGLMPACRRTLVLALPFALASAPVTPKISPIPPAVSRNIPAATIPHVWQVET